MTRVGALFVLADLFERASRHLTKSADKLMLRDIERAWTRGKSV